MVLCCFHLTEQFAYIVVNSPVALGVKPKWANCARRALWYGVKTAVQGSGG
jgi:hypothetical protein